MTELIPIASPVWMAPMWKPVRPFCLSRLEVTLGDGAWPGGLPAPDITVQLVVAEDPKEGTNGGYLVVAEATLGVGDRRVVEEVPWPFGPRILPAGWWVAACHNVNWLYLFEDEVIPVLTLQLHGTDV